MSRLFYWGSTLTFILASLSSLFDHSIERIIQLDVIAAVLMATAVYFKLDERKP